MTISAPFILRPIATTLLFVTVTVLGAIGYYFLPVAPLPAVDFPTIQITTSFPGASPEVVETSITAPLEHYFGQISDLTSMDSTSSSGTSQITLQFALSRNIDAAAQDVQAAINAASGWVPISLLPAPPIYRLVNPADAPVLILALTSDVLPLYRVNDYADTVLVQKLSQLPGVGQVSVEGGQTRAVRLHINPVKAAGMGLSLEDVRLAISATTTDIPKGELDGPRQAFDVGANDQLFTADAFNAAVLAYRKEGPIFLRDIGHAIEGPEDSELAASYNGVPAVLLDIRRQPGANAIDVVDSIRTLLPKLRANVPPALKIAIVTDRTETIRASIADVQLTLLLTVALVVLVIFLFLRKFWATVIPGIVLPVSIIATFAVMAVLHFSIDNLSLMALTVASGFVVDDAIVMIENIARYVEAGETPFDAALNGSKQIGFTVVSLTISLIAVFIPLLLMGGVVGRLFREFAVTLSLAVAISGAVSLTLTPMMCGHLLAAKSEDSQANEFLRWSERGFDLLIRGYTAGLDWVLRHCVLTLLFAAATIAMTGCLYAIVPKGFLPEQDTGLLIGTTDAPQDISFAEMAARQSRLVDVIRQTPSVVSVASFVGAGIVNPTLNTGHLYIDIGSPNRRAPASAIVQSLYRRAMQVSGIALHLRPVQDISIEVRPTRTQYQEVVQALSDDELRLWTARLVASLQHMAEFTDVASDQQDDGLQILITVDRAAAARFGVTMSAVDQTLYDAFGQRQITTVYTPLTQYHVILEVDPMFRNEPGVLDKIFIGGQDATSINSVNGGGTGGVGSDFHQASSSIPLSAFTHREERTAPLAITHQGLFPAITVSFNLADGVSLGRAVETLQKEEQRLGLPDTITTTLVGEAAEFVASLQNETLLILAAIVTVYIVLGILYESFIHPVTILSTLPSAGVGALLGLIVAGEPLDVISLIAIVLLIGIVKKNAILMVDFALAAERERGETPTSAIREACRLRFRPIMMTTMAALLGAIPLAMGTGIGSEFRRPLGVALVGGLIFSQTLTLYTTPVIYLAFHSLQQSWRGRLRSSTTDGSRPATGGW